MDPLSSTLPPGHVFDGLAASSTEDRDAATRIAIALGTEVSSKLLLWDELTPSNRARRLWAFMGVHLRRGADMVRQPRSFDLEHTGTLGSLLDVLAEKHGVLTARDLPAALVTKPVSIAMRDATLLAVLDAACAQAGCRGGQRARGELVVHDEREPGFPAAYSGPMRVRILELRTSRSTDFTATSVAAQARLRIEWEWPVGPVGPLSIRIHGDDRRYDASPVTNVVNVGMVAELVVDVPQSSPLALAGTVSAMFEGAYEDLRLPIGSSATLHGLAVNAFAQDSGPHLTIKTVDQTRLTGTVDLGLSPMILGIATNGEEGIPQIHRMRVATNAPGSERWGLRFRDGFGQIAELRLRIAAAPVRGKLAFALPPIPLP
ncbi:MAG: hypothetical protein H0V17_05805 [Deltaproteobacteria bacterium]|nr:hypothetical protein [Deltaproteobacteria bacterium]